MPHIKAIRRIPCFGSLDDLRKFLGLNLKWLEDIVQVGMGSCTEEMSDVLETITVNTPSIQHLLAFP